MGYLRLTLALVIMAGHLSASAGVISLGHLSVLVFYVLAGYTATVSMQGPYRGRTLLFMFSRIARLWPSYLAVFALSLAWIHWVGPWQSIGLPAEWRVFPEFLMLVQAGIPSPVPTGWVLPWFFLGYSLIAIGIANNPRRCGFFLIGALFFSQWYSFRVPFVDYYFSPLLALLGFAVGSAVHHLGIDIPRDNRTGRIAGELSYPVFLSHYLIGAAVSIGHGVPPCWLLFFASLPPTLALSWILVVAIERPIARYRQRLKSSTS